MMTRPAAEELLKQLLAVSPETGVPINTRLNQQLWEAASRGSLDAITTTLRQGAQVNARGPYGDSALNMAAEGGHVDAVEFLLEASADIENQGGADKTPLMNAAFAGRIKVVDLLLRRGARINRDLLNTLQLKVNILEENAEAGMILPAAVEAWRRFLDFMIERWREQSGLGSS
jgi:ankyrin repeat protein